MLHVMILAHAVSQIVFLRNFYVKFPSRYNRCVRFFIVSVGTKLKP